MAGSGNADTLRAWPSHMPTRRLANLIAAYAPHDGAFPLRLPGLHAIRLSRVTSEASYATLGPILCIAAQGAKAIMLGREVVEYDASHFLVFAVDLPVSSQVIRASRREPYLGFILDLDPNRIADLASRVYPRGVPKSADSRGLYVGPTSNDLIDAVTRLLELQARPDDVELLAPLVIDEVLIRILRTSVGARVAQIGHAQSGLRRLAKAVSWIREHFAQPLTIQEMADSAEMGTSAFHQRFRAVTSLSPLQYQKVLRLHEARRLMLFQQMDAASASLRVGYLSASQFSREYHRFFGSAPSKDIATLRANGVGRPQAENAHIA